jgi:hypothetical protein
MTFCKDPGFASSISRRWVVLDVVSILDKQSKYNGEVFLSCDNIRCVQYPLMSEDMKKSSPLRR